MPINREREPNQLQNLVEQRIHKLVVDQYVDNARDLPLDGVFAVPGILLVMASGANAEGADNQVAIELAAHQLMNNRQPIVEAAPATLLEKPVSEWLNQLDTFGGDGEPPLPPERFDPQLDPLRVDYTIGAVNFRPDGPDTNGQILSLSGNYQLQVWGRVKGQEITSGGVANPNWAYMDVFDPEGNYITSGYLSEAVSDLPDQATDFLDAHDLILTPYEQARLAERTPRSNQLLGQTTELPAGAGGPRTQVNTGLTETGIQVFDSIVTEYKDILRADLLDWNVTLDPDQLVLAELWDQGSDGVWSVNLLAGEMQDGAWTNFYWGLDDTGKLSRIPSEADTGFARIEPIAGLDNGFEASGRGPNGESVDPFLVATYRGVNLAQFNPDTMRWEPHSGGSPLSQADIDALVNRGITIEELADTQAELKSKLAVGLSLISTEFTNEVRGGLLTQAEIVAELDTYDIVYGILAEPEDFIEGLELNNQLELRSGVPLPLDYYYNSRVAEGSNIQVHEVAGFAAIFHGPAMQDEVNGGSGAYAVELINTEGKIRYRVVIKLNDSSDDTTFASGTYLDTTLQEGLLNGFEQTSGFGSWRNDTGTSKAAIQAMFSRLTPGDIIFIQTSGAEQRTEYTTDGLWQRIQEANLQFEAIRDGTRMIPEVDESISRDFPYYAQTFTLVSGFDQVIVPVE